MSLEEELNKIWQEAEKEFALVSDLENLEKLRVKYLGRKSYLADFPRLLKNLPFEEKRKIGSFYNQLKEKINQIYLEQKEKILNKEKDVWRKEIKFVFEHPGKELTLGKEHLLYKTIKEIQDIFIRLGFSIVDYRQIVDEKENFDYLNIPRYHPARDLWDTLWVNPDLNSRFKVQNSRMLFRTHTTAFQVPLFRKFQPPIRAIIAGKVFRHEAIDKTHDFEFNQFDGISVSENTNLANLRYVVEKFFEKFFEEKIKIRFRPGYFPFVEPGLEIDISCIFCRQKGCSVCKKTGWLEVAGAGMIHPYVFQCAGIDNKKYQGWAFGFGVERLIMLRHSIDDIRILHSSDLRFIEQF